MAIVLILVVIAVVMWSSIRDQNAMVRNANRGTARAQRTAPPADIDMRALLEAAGRLAPRENETPRSTSEVPWIPPYESADPLWDRDLDQRSV